MCLSELATPDNVIAMSMVSKALGHQQAPVREAAINTILEMAK
jgi:hypothetical protein